MMLLHTYGCIGYLSILAFESSTYSYQYLKTAKMHATFGASESMQATCVSSVTFRGIGEYCMAFCAAWSSYKDHCINYSHSQGFIQTFSLTTSSRLTCTTRTAENLGAPHRLPSWRCQKMLATVEPRTVRHGPYLSYVTSLRYCGLYFSIRS